MESIIPASQMRRVTYSARLALIALVAGVVLAAFYLGDRALFAESVPLFIDLSRPPEADIFSLGGMCILISAAITLSFTLISYRLFAVEREDLSALERLAFKGRDFWIARITVALVMGAMITLGTWLVFLLLGSMFTNARLTYLGAVIACGLWSFFIGGLITYWMSGLTTTGLYVLAGLAMFVGLSTAFLLARNPEWWRRSLSYLGHDPGSSDVFNLSIISVGLITLALAVDLINNLRILARANIFPKRSFTIMRIGLPFLCVMVIGIGLFPTTISDLSDALHNISAHVLALLAIIGMLSIRFIIPDTYPPVFSNVSIALGLTGVALFVSWFVLHIINFVAFEIFLFIVVMSWVYLLNRFTRQYVRQQDVEEIKQALEADDEGV